MTADTSTGPIIVIATATPLPGKTDEVIAGLSELIPVVHDEPGCILYTLNRAENGDVVFIEKWASQADSDHHGATSSIMPTLIANVSPLLVGPPVVVTHRPVPLGGPKGAL